MNTLYRIDAYKVGHGNQYPDGLTQLYSYFAPRKAAYDNQIVWFGLQALLKEYLCKPITKAMVREYLDLVTGALGPLPETTIKQMEALGNLGYWPLKIKALPEGAVVGKGTACMTITNTLPEFAWTVTFLESLLLKVWFSSTVASYSAQYYRVAKHFSDVTCDNDLHMPWAVHDFSYRSVSSEESAARGGAAHLIKFQGTDTLPAIKFLQTYYPTCNPNTLIGGSVPATEHSVACSYKPTEDSVLNELAYMNAMLDKYPTGVLSVVSDTYDYYRTLTQLLPRVKERILARDGKYVVRPDSGDPETIICGDPNAPIGSPEYKGSLVLLDELFGSTLNSKGYKVLNPKIGLIYGDGMFLGRYETILARMERMGYASSNLVVGVGGLLVQNHSRDDAGWASKASFAIIKGEIVSLQKDPATDHSKKSYKGLIQVVKTVNAGYVTVDDVSPEEEQLGELQVVFQDGLLYKNWYLEDIRSRKD